MVKVCEVPVQLGLVGVTVTLAVMGKVVKLAAVKLGISPVPDDANPIAGFVLVQLYEVAPIPEKLIAEVDNPAQINTSAGSVTVGFELTVMVNVWVGPGQVPFIGVTTTFAVWVTPLEFIVINDPIFPVPLAARPIDGFEFSQLYEVAAEPVKLIAAVGIPPHMI